jgi:tetratricopeptide (TPR) repeat protein
VKKNWTLIKLLRYLVWNWKTITELDNLLSEHKFTEVIDLTNVMLDRLPKDHLAYYYKGLAYEGLGWYDEAISNFLQSELELKQYRLKFLMEEDFIRIQIGISRVYRKKQDFEKALEYAEKAIRIKDNKVEGFVWHADIKEEMGDYLEALESINKAIKIKPHKNDLIESRNRLIYIIVQDKWDKASR